MEQSMVVFEKRRTLLYTPRDLDECTDLPALLNCEGRAVITIIGNISLESPEYRQECQRMLEEVVFPFAQRTGAILLTKGFRLDPPFDQDLPWLIDHIGGSRFPDVRIIGVVLDCSAAIPEKVQAESWRYAPLCEHHYAYILVPGLNEREACRWRTTLATAISTPHKTQKSAQPGVTIVFSGAAMGWFDVLGSIQQGRHVIGITHVGSFTSAPIIGVSADIELLLAGWPPPETCMLDLNRRLEAEAGEMVASGRLAALWK